MFKKQAEAQSVELQYQHVVLQKIQIFDKLLRSTFAI